MRKRTIVGLGAIAALVSAYASPDWRAVGYMPARVAVGTGGTVRLADRLPHGVTLRREGGDGALSLSGRTLGHAWQALPRAAAAAVTARARGTYHVEVGAFGVPLRRVRIDALPAQRLTPGGESIGIDVRTAGLLVVARSQAGRWRWPPGGPALEVGDRIVAAAGRSVASAATLAAAAQEAGARRRPLCLRVLRTGRPTRVCVPLRAGPGRAYHLGVLVRSSVSGIGTLTLYDPRTGLYAALGHRIQDGWDGQSVPVVGGRIAPAPIVDIRRGFVGRPGEKVGRVQTSPRWGAISGSGPYGIFGHLEGRVLPGETMPLATADEVHVGRASLWTVVEGQRVEHFRVRIERVDLAAPGGRGIVLRVVDRGLLRRTGGIVQGMSGSPIIQNGRIAGVLTHVLVSDSTRGYGVFAAWMWHEARDAVRSEHDSRLTPFDKTPNEARMGLARPRIN